MSTVGTGTDSDSKTDAALEPRIQVEEHEERIIEDYPSNITEQLQRAAFDKESADTYVKHHHPINGSGESKIVKVELEEDQLKISVKDVVGVVNLTPTSKLQINPKIGWNDILEIFLTVQQRDRSLEYHGIPIRDFLAEDLRIEDIFVVVAVNYLNSLDQLFRQGFTRDFETKRVDALDARGRIDVDRSLKNHAFANGVPKQHFIQKEIDYNTPENLLVYQAAIELRRLFQYHADTYNHRGYFRIFSRVEDAIRRLEDHGITGNNDRFSSFTDVSLADLPRQRHYYSEAINISKTILSSSIGEPLDHGQQDLTMDYILSMESLFEKYSLLVLKEQLQRIEENPRYASIDNVTIDKESHQIFSDTNDFTYQPDHVVRRNGDPVAVIDSKYYAEDHDPLKDNWGRSRLFSYAYHLQTDRLAFLCPLGTPQRHQFAERPGELEVVTTEDRFSIEGYKTCIRDYLCSVLDIGTDTILSDNLRNFQVCHPDVTATSLDDVLGNKQLERESVLDSSFSIFKHIVNRHSDDVSRIDNFSNWHTTYKQFQSYLKEQSPGYDYIVPLFIPLDTDIEVWEYEEEPDSDSADKERGERLLLHRIVVNDSDELVDWDVVKPFDFDQAG